MTPTDVQSNVGDDDESFRLKDMAERARRNIAALPESQRQQLETDEQSAYEKGRAIMDERVNPVSVR